MATILEFCTIILVILLVGCLAVIAYHLSNRRRIMRLKDPLRDHLNKNRSQPGIGEPRQNKKEN